MQISKPKGPLSFGPRKLLVAYKSVIMYPFLTDLAVDVCASKHVWFSKNVFYTVKPRTSLLSLLSNSDVTF